MEFIKETLACISMIVVLTALAFGMAALSTEADYRGGRVEIRHE